MMLFEECKKALNGDIVIVDSLDVQNIWNKVPFKSSYIEWGEFTNKEYDDIHKLLETCVVEDTDVFVFADDTNIPVFKTSLESIAKNIDDVTALCPVLFFLNESYIIQVLFPSNRLRLGFFD